MGKKAPKVRILRMKVCETVITSRQNGQVVLLGKLGERKHRAKEGLFRFDGKKLFLEAVLCGLDIRRIFLRASESAELISLVREREEALPETVIYVLADDMFDKLSEERAPEGILSVAAFPSFQKDTDILEDYAKDGQKRVFLIESVRDPGNVGTILRSAAAFGVDLLVMSRDCADLYNPKTVRGAMGALFRQRIVLWTTSPRQFPPPILHGFRGRWPVPPSLPLPSFLREIPTNPYNRHIPAVWQGFYLPGG